MPLTLLKQSGFATPKLLLLTTVFGSLAIPSLPAEEVPSIGPPASWVRPINFELPQQAAGSASTQTGSHYLLLDEQIDVETQTRYVHRSIRIDNVNGAQNQGRQTFDFQPTYQALVFHRLDVVRNGTRRNQLDADNIKTLQRETDLNLHLYDGSMTALVIIEDLRPGDIIDYAYSVQGANPVLDGHFLTSFSFNYSVPVDHIRCLIRSPQGTTYQVFEEGTPPASTVFTESDGFRIEEWVARSSAALLWEDGTPAWHNPYNTVRISDFESWEEVVKWGLPLYEKATEGQAEICADPVLPAAYRDTSASLESRINAAIEFVQDEVRYFGIETGPNSLQPHDARLAFRQRFGDCKDKSSLLISLLRGLGVKAYPVLVNTNQIRTPQKGPPTPYLFNHVVVVAERESGPPILIDATYSYQRGLFPHRYQPDYGWGLPLAEGATGLVDLPSSGPDSYTLRIKESFDLDEADEPMTLRIVSHYGGGYADSQRSFFQSRSSEEIEKSYLEYYGNYYDYLEVEATPEIVDNANQNEIQVSESYRIGVPWAYEGGSRTLTFDSPILKSALTFPSAKNRSMPLKLAYPQSLSKAVVCRLPRKWEGKDSEERIDNPYFSLERTVRYSDSQVAIDYTYTAKTDEVPADDFENYLSDANKAWKLLSLEIEDDISIPNQTSDVQGESSKVELALSLILAALAARFSYNSLRRQIDPITPENGYSNKKITSIRTLMNVAVLATILFFCLDLANIFSNGGHAYSSLGSIERIAIAASLYERLFFAIWAVMAGRSLSHQSPPTQLARKLIHAHTLFLVVWLIVRSGIQNAAFGYQHTHLLEVAVAVAISLAAWPLFRARVASPPAPPPLPAGR